MLINNPVITGSFTVNGTNFITNTPSTGSNTFNGNQIISGSAIVTGSLQVTGSITTTGTITAQTLVVSTISSSIEYASGSNIFGSNQSNVQQFTGSVYITGSLALYAGSQTIRSSANQVLLLSSSFSTGLYTSYQSGSTVIGDIGNGSQLFTAGDVTSFGINARDYRKLQLGVAQTVVMTVTGSSVGIGTAAVNSNHKLEVNGATATTGINLGNMTALGSLGSGYLYLPYTGGIGFRSADGSTAKALIQGDNSSNLLLNPSGGNVGIGTSSPSTTLQISGGATANRGQLTIVDTSSVASQISFYSSSAYNAWVLATGTELQLQNYNNSSYGTISLNPYGGKVGVGTSSPLSAFHQVGGGAYYTADSRFGGSTTGFGIEVKYDQGSATSGSIYCSPGYASSGILFRLGAGSGNTNQMVLTGAGNVLFGTTSVPSAYGLVAIRGTNQGLTIQDAVSNGYRSLYFQSGNLYFYNGTNEGYLSSAGTWVNASDATLKKDVKDIEYGLNEVMQLKPKSYKMIDDDLEQIGFIAQDVEEIIPELVSTSEKGMKGLSYGQLTAVLVKAIQELKAEIETLKNK